MTPETLLVTDVDGTLLDRRGVYAMSQEEIRAVQAHLTIVLASSRTVLELSRNQRDLGLAGPVIAENGAVIALPWHPALVEDGVRELIGGRVWCLRTIGSSAVELRAELRAGAAAVGISYVEQYDEGNRLDRRCSVLFTPSVGTPVSGVAMLVEHLRVRGCTVASGGDWIAVTRDADKGVGLRTLLHLLAKVTSTPARVVAVGDGDNDVPLLLSAAYRFIVRDEKGAIDRGLHGIPGAIVLDPPGIGGWRTLVRDLVNHAVR